ncbi:HEPN-associated N-terminal domain-containing protein [Pedobacter cryoconitis]|uniref:HEPN-associated N-terminal domain-containing protein n=1 Tax=Pedobacter cryoconitis TaxID=188932 RepID=UPI0016117C8B|nr:HEPN-associated N-terminal domain-containing protein [Pedobacter cryoconitis]MBB5645914.1 hypothetical protein [Pedobacter cryoconitis]
MGHYKEMYGYNNQGGNDFGDDKCLCEGHLKDDAIAEYIRKNSDDGVCSYCGEYTKIALARDVFSFIKGGVFAFYGEVNDEGMAYETEEDGYHGAPKFDTEDMLYYEIGLETDNDNLWKDILLVFGNQEWCEKDPYADRENVELEYNWNQFKQVVKHKSRYVFLGSNQFKESMNQLPVDEILDDIGRRVDNLNLFKLLPIGTLLYRCRQHKSSEILTQAKQLAAPPYHLANTSNRMSPAGISMFYCAFDVPTCHAETIDATDIVKDQVTTGVFQNKEKLFLLDLTKLPALPSIFDPAKRNNYFSIMFLEKFVQDLSKPIEKDGSEHIEYVPTQIITEYFRYTYEDRTGGSVDGIIYPSSKLGGKYACVLFYDHVESIKKLEFVDTKLETTPIFKNSSN